MTSNQYGMGDWKNFLFFNVGPELLTFGLLDREKLPRSVQRLQTSKAGRSFLVELKKRVDLKAIELVKEL